MILSAIRIANNGSSEKEKMRNTLKQVLEDFLNYQSYGNTVKTSRDINFLEESQVDFICSRDYYEGKLKGEFQYSRIVKNEEEDEAKVEQEEEKKSLNQSAESAKEQQNT